MGDEFLMLPGPVVEASNDAGLRGAPFAVYIWLLGNLLDNCEFRPVKVTGLAGALRIKRHTASRSLRVLTERGYLERRYLGRAGYAYRAMLTRRLTLLVPLNGPTRRTA